MNKDEKIDAFGCGVYILIILISFGISFIVSKFIPLKGDEGFWISFGIGAILFGILIFMGLRAKKDEDRAAIQKPRPADPPEKEIILTGKNALYYEGYDHVGDCPYCEVLFTSSEKRFCKWCGAYECKHCGRCLCGYEGDYEFE